MGVLQVLAPSDLRQVVSTYRDALRSHQDELNRLNVYPVPDGDTGTNMALTLESVVGELSGLDIARASSANGDSDMADTCAAIKHGSLMGARGNSGVILSQILRGLADTFAPLDSVSGADVVAGLRRASDAAYEAVLRPVEGTILTVVRAAAEAVEQGFAGVDVSLSDVLERAAEAARDAVAHTPDLLPVLRDAGVVDAGGRGFELLLAACLNVVSERPVPEPEAVATPPSVAAHLHAEHGHAAPAQGAGASGVADMRYEVMYFLHAPDEHIDTFKSTWGALGDSIVVVGGDGLWNCHVHTNDIGGAIEAGIAAGRPETIRVTDLFEQVADLEEADWVRAHTGGRRPEGCRSRSADACRHRGGRGRDRRRSVGAAERARRAARGVGRPVDEPVHRAAPRRGRPLRGRRRDRVAEQQEHRAGGASGARAHGSTGRRGADRRGGRGTCGDGRVSARRVAR